MYVLKHGIKKNPERFWALPDRVFFGYGACPILTGTFLRHPPMDGFYGERIIPGEGFSGNHLYVTNGVIAFDYHGYSSRERLLEHHRRVWASHSAGWHCTLERVDFDLLDTTELNRRKMRGPDQYLHDPVPRAVRYLQRIDHAEAAARASKVAMRLKPLTKLAKAGPQ
ncbi:hypothetical protein RFM41_09895 [Mesorhizobium sp. VK25A]|uniref:GIY-YIG domain-containing protein n=1 Tax=Mesorhizobium vachelliae TaxID=3072309 RepID=A0ABU5A4G1_9HYPH|nr:MULTISPECIES: hypothetical protein [unclassified Mesorhizobium]MDX8531507.1 hypothetical protein [Mesorhizobium sp. VK25D]MDX8544051.1 hypothetical protein [Mesorhizobium sp. VK25A]